MPLRGGERNPAKKLYAWMEAAKMRRWKRQHSDAQDLQWPAPKTTHRHFVSFVRGLRFLSFLTWWIFASMNVSGRRRNPDTVVFVGGMDSVPNRDAVSYFVSDILPLIQMEVPGVRFIAAGRNAAPSSAPHFPTVQLSSLRAHYPTFDRLLPKRRCRLFHYELAAEPG